MINLESIRTNFENSYQKQTETPAIAKKIERLQKAKLQFDKKIEEVNKKITKWRKKKVEEWNKKKNAPKEDFSITDPGEKKEIEKKHKRAKLTVKIARIVLAVLAILALSISFAGFLAEIPLLYTIGNCITPVLTGLSFGMPQYYNHTELRKKQRVAKSANFQEFVNNHVKPAGFNMGRSEMLDQNIHQFYKDYKTAVKKLPKIEGQ